MKKVFCVVFLALMIINVQDSGACASGGEGSTSCSLSTTVTVLGVSTTRTSSVTCGDGYYACCTTTGASCIQKWGKSDNDIPHDN